MIQRTKLLYIACSKWTWQWPLKTFNWGAVGAEAIKLKLMKITSTEENRTLCYICAQAYCMNESDIVKVGGSAFCKVELFLQKKTALCKIMEELKVL